MNQITRSNGKPYTLKENKNRFFFPAEFMKVFDLLREKQKHTIRCQINTGARINELRYVNEQNVDLINKRVTLRVTKTKAKKKEGKGRVRIIPISSDFAKYLKAYYKSNKRYGILSTPAVNTSLKVAAKKAGLENPGDFSSHSLRKTLETWLMALGCQDSALCAHLGHDIRTAVSHYISPDVFSWEEKRQMRMVIGDLYGR